MGDFPGHPEWVGRSVGTAVRQLSEEPPLDRFLPDRRSPSVPRCSRRPPRDQPRCVLSLVLPDLHRTVAVRWRAELAGRTHGATKAGYYRAVAALLAAGADAAGLGWTDVVAAVE